MANDKKLIVGKCPNCMTTLRIYEGESVSCPRCDQTISAEQIQNGSDLREQASVPMHEQSGAARYAQFIENPASGLAYLENRFETMDWKEFETSLIFDLDGIPSVIEKNKVTNANDPDTWLLEYKSVAEVLRHKLIGLKKLVHEIERHYNPTDLTNTFAAFDKYSRLSAALVARRASIYKTIDSDIRFLEKFDAQEDVISAIKSDYAELKEDCDKLRVVNKIDEIPGIDEIIARTQQKIADELSKIGINAEQLYNEAIANLADKSNAHFALEKFQKLNGYKDSSKYIEKINNLSIFNNVIEANGELFYMVSAKNETTFYVTEPKKNPVKLPFLGKFGKNKSEPEQSETSAEPGYTGKVLSIYAIKDQLAEKTPLVSGISRLLTSYNGKLFFISGDKEIKSFDFNTHEVTVLDKGHLGCYYPVSSKNSNRIIWGANRQSIYIKKRLESKPAILEKSGCLKKKTPPEYKPQMNNFSLLKVDLNKNSASIVVDEFIDVMDVYGNLVFLTQSRETDYPVTDKHGKTTYIKQPKTFFTSYNLQAGVVVDMLDEHAMIVDATAEKIVYSRYNPSMYNMSLYVYDIPTRRTDVLEENIYDAYKIHDDMVLYSVGSFGRRSMFSIKLDGTCRTEILLNVEKICFFDKNWMYVIKGNSYNKTLIKISLDGKQRIIVASEIKEIIENNAGYVYYIDYDGRLCMVRNDGKDFRVITGNCDDAEIIINNDNIFIMAKERMNASGSVYNTSLYTMDLQGHNLKKLYYGLEDMCKIDDRRIFFLQKQVKEYSITTPQEKGDPVVTYIKPTVSTYYCYDKVDHKIDKLLVLGEPKEQTFEFKKGCFGKKVKSEHSIITEITRKTEYTRSDKLTAGQLDAEDKKKEEEAKAQSENNPASSAQSASAKGINHIKNLGCRGCRKRK